MILWAIWREVGEHFHLVHEFSAGVEGANVVQILRVHDDDEVELGEVSHTNLARFAIEIVAAFGSVFAHSVVGRLACMPAARARRVDVDLLSEAGIRYDPFHDAFRSGRAADIAHADEEEVERL